MRALLLSAIVVVMTSSLCAQIVEIGGGTTPVPYPFKSGYGYDYTAAVYLASEINQLGDITAISFYHSGGISAKDVPCSIMLKSTANTTLPTLDWATLTSGSTTVYSGSFRYTSATAGWVSFTLSSTFALTAGKNLLVLTTASAADGGDPWGSGGGEMHYGHEISSMTGNMEIDMFTPSALDPFSTRPNIQFNFTPLPVQLAEFTAAPVSGTVLLSWRTISEVNNYGFTVQARPRGVGVFSDIPGAFIPGHGTTTAEHRYTWTMSSTDHQASEYRLKQVDLDGAEHFSEPVTCTFTGVTAKELPTTCVLDQNYPNPFNPSTTIRFGLPTTEHVSICVYSVLGQEMMRVVDGVFEPGFHSAEVDGRSLASGLYYYRMVTPSHAQTRSFLLLR